MTDTTNETWEFGTCRCCHHDKELLYDDGRCSSCVSAGVTEEWEVDQDDDGGSEMEYA